jgi:hypothetical protein
VVMAVGALARNNLHMRLFVCLVVRGLAGGVGLCEKDVSPDEYLLSCSPCASFSAPNLPLPLPLLPVVYTHLPCTNIVCFRLGVVDATSPSTMMRKNSQIIHHHVPSPRESFFTRITPLPSPPYTHARINNSPSAQRRPNHSRSPYERRPVRCVRSNKPLFSTSHCTTLAQ